MECKECLFKAMNTCPSKEECEELCWMQNFWEDKNLRDIKELKEENTRLKEENERLEAENKILLGQLVINDGEDVTVQISESQFDEYNKYRQTLQEIKAIAKRNIFLSPKLLEINGDIGQIQNIAITQILDLITKAEEE